ncbi:MAG: group II truncated hemoglobin [Pseudomonadota bacterium]
MTEATTATSAPFELLGGRDGVAAIVDRFYDLMDTQPAFAELRAMHGADLTPMRHSLTGFLTAWVGGPRDWFLDHPNSCMMSAHARLGVTSRTADQWLMAMAAALRDTGVSEDLANRLEAAFAPMTNAMIARA